MDCGNDLEEYQSRRKLEFGPEEILVLENEAKEEKGNIYTKSRTKKIHSNIFDKIIPKVSMEFKIEEEAYDFYNAYVYKVGFGIRRSKGQKGKNGRMISRTFRCSYEGYHGKDRRDINVKCHGAETRFSCLAIMKINSRQASIYSVIEFIA
ncbi:FHY3/FAR1 family [Parasponia andersonii]|uniref:FHY3/FAR1 family n=1 Tax=Parasponia andersonii TaxID=3476 RepID=A0A2P5AQ73_PARAD|nr:FHY3/FAR1 family [Parasponia andersonii]